LRKNTWLVGSLNIGKPIHLHPEHMDRTRYQFPA
jgi:hypothetical protein